MKLLIEDKKEQLYKVYDLNYFWVYKQYCVPDQDTTKKMFNVFLEFKTGGSLFIDTKYNKLLIIKNPIDNEKAKRFIEKTNKMIKSAFMENKKLYYDVNEKSIEVFG